MTDASSLSSLAREKLHLSLSKDPSLHRWVLLKNSILYSPSIPTTPPPSPAPPPFGSDEDDDGDDLVASDAFMFPDAGDFASVHSSTSPHPSEAQWLDSLLETLADDDDDYDLTGDPEHILPQDDEFPPFSPPVSPMSSSDDLHTQPAFYSVPICVPYSVPYAPMLAHNFDSSIFSHYDYPFPYHDFDPVPDAIEDTSDDESDVPTTPSLGRSSSSLSLVDAASIPLPQEPSRLRNSTPRVYVDADHSYFHPFDLDPLPFPEQHLNTPYNGYQEC